MHELPVGSDLHRDDPSHTAEPERVKIPCLECGKEYGGELVERLLLAEHNLHATLRQTSSVTAALHACLRSALEVSGMDGGRVDLIRSDGSVELAAHERLSPAVLQSVSYDRIPDQHAGILQQGHPLYLPCSGLATDGTATQASEKRLAAAMVPICHRGSTVACMNLVSHTMCDIPLEIREAIESIVSYANAAVARIQTEEALHETEEALHALAEHSDDIIMRFDPEMRYRYVNPAAQRHMHIPQAVLIGKTPEEIGIPPHLCSIWREAHERVLAAEDNLRIEFQFPSGNWVHATLFAEHGSDGRITAVVVTAREAIEDQRMMAPLTTDKSVLRGIFQTLPIAVSLTVNRVLVVVNDMMCELIACGEQELLGRNTKDFYLSEEEYEAAGRTLYTPVFQGRIGTVESRLRNMKGEVFDVILSAALLRAGDPTAGAVVTFQDITSRKRAEESLRASEAMWRSVLKAAPIGIVFIRDRKIVSINDAMSTMVGYTEQELIGHSTRILYGSDEEFEEIGYRLYTLAPEQGGGHIDSVQIRKDGTKIDVRLYAAMRQPGDPSAGYVILGVNVTAQKRAEENLKASESRLRSVISAAPIGIAFCSNQTILSVNDAMCHMLGYAEEELVGKRTRLLYASDEECEEVARRFYEQIPQQGLAIVEAKHVQKNGTLIDVCLHAAGLRIEDPRSGLVVLLQDITEQKRAEQNQKRLEAQLQQAMKMEAVGRLAGGVAHDFNNLLTTIIGNVELARSENGVTESVMQYLQEILTAGKSAASLTRQLLAFSRKQIIEPKRLNLNSLVNNLAGILGRLIGENITLEISVSDDLSPVKVDPGQFEQVLINLAVNARDAMPDGGRLSIATENVALDAAFCVQRPDMQPGHFVLVSVRDSGHGMEPEVKEHLFEPFFTTKAMGKGTGLGLATIFGVVKQAGGHLEVESEPGKGSVFTIYLPRCETPPDTSLGERYAGKPPRGTETILVVEDEPSVLGIAKRLLEFAGYRVLCASNGKEALALFEESRERIDLMMTDVVMPGMNGRELMEQLRSTHPDLRVLFASGYTDDINVLRGVRELNMDFIAKPYSASALAKKVREVLDR